MIPTKHIAGMFHWREAVSAAIQRNSEQSATYFSVPSLQVVEMGTEIEIRASGVDRDPVDPGAFLRMSR